MKEILIVATFFAFCIGIGLLLATITARGER